MFDNHVATRRSVRILLLNDQHELLLMCIEGFDIASKNGIKHDRFWCTVGGGLEDGETIEQAAYREIHEETGIEPDNITLGPVVWHGNVELKLKGINTLLEEYYIVAHTHHHDVKLHLPTDDEKNVVTTLQWFSLEAIKKSDEIIFPRSLATYLPAILAGNYPSTPLHLPE